jgi:hypothetical protein
MVSLEEIIDVITDVIRNKTSNERQRNDLRWDRARGNRVNTRVRPDHQIYHIQSVMAVGRDLEGIPNAVLTAMLTMPATHSYNMLMGRYHVLNNSTNFFKRYNLVLEGYVRHVNPLAKVINTFMLNLLANYQLLRGRLLTKALFTETVAIQSMLRVSKPLTSCNVEMLMNDRDVIKMHLIHEDTVLDHEGRWSADTNRHGGQILTANLEKVFIELSYDQLDMYKRGCLHILGRSRLTRGLIDCTFATEQNSAALAMIKAGLHNLKSALNKDLGREQGQPPANDLDDTRFVIMGSPSRVQKILAISRMLDVVITKIDDLTRLSEQAVTELHSHIAKLPNSGGL